MLRALLAVLVVVILAVGGAVAVDRARDEATAAPTTTSTDPTTTSSSTTTTTIAPSTTSTTSTTPPPAPVTAGRGASFVGLGTWVDVFDFSPHYMQEGESTPVVTPAAVDAMAAAGIRTLYLQVSRDDERTVGLLEQPELLGRFLVRAHERGMKVVGWYLPKKYDDGDLERFRAIRDFRVDGHAFDAIGVDIEFRGEVPDTPERNRRLVELSQRLRDEVGDFPLAAIVLPPVVTDIINLAYWPSFPWREIAPFYDVWLPMSYWTNRDASSGWRDPYRYTATNIALLREHLGDAEAPVHPIGGIGDAAAASEYAGFVRAASEAGSLGWSVYDYRTTDPAAWSVLTGVAAGS